MESSSTIRITVKSSDGQEFLISQSTAVLSDILKNAIDDGFVVIPIPNIDGKTLDKIITYLKQHDAPDDVVLEEEKKKFDEEKKKFDEEFISGQEMSDLIDIVLAASYLDIKDLMEIVCQKIADIMKNKSVKWVRKTFNIENDFTPEEEAAIKKEYLWAWEGVEPDEDD